MIKKLDHIAIAVKDLDEGIKTFVEKLGFQLKGIEEVEDQGVKTAFLSTENGEHIELVCPTSANSPVANFLEKRGPGLHHIAFEVSAPLENAIQDLLEKEVPMIDKSPKIGANNKKIAFLHPKGTQGVLFEICRPNQQT